MNNTSSLMALSGTLCILGFHESNSFPVCCQGHAIHSTDSKVNLHPTDVDLDNWFQANV